MEIFIVVAYLAVGWVFSYWFGNHYLDNQAFSDGVKWSLPWAIGVNLGWSAIAFVMIICLMLDNIPSFIRSLFRKVYGLK